MSGRERSDSQLTRQAIKRPALWALCLIAQLLLVPVLQASLRATASSSLQQEGIQRPIVQGIRVEGANRYQPEELIRALGQRVGEPLDPGSIDRGIEVLWSSLRVRALPSVREVPTGVEILLTVTEMAFDLEPRFIGNVEIGTDLLREWALFGREELFLFQSASVRRRILEQYKREGFYWAEVEVITRGESERGAKVADGVEGEIPDVIFEIREGPRVRVAEVDVRGNQSLKDKGLFWWAEGLKKYSQPKLGGPNWLKLRFKGTQFVEEELEADLLAMRNAYRERGWLDVVIEVPEGGFKFNKKRDEVRIVVRVDEGPRYTVSSLNFRAVQRGEPGTAAASQAPVPTDMIFDEEILKGLCLLKPGEPYQTLLTELDRRALRSHYGAEGYLNHPSLPAAVRWDFLEPERIFSADKPEVAITYVLHPGRPQTINEARVSGTTHTLDRAVRNRLSIFPGEPADQSEIERSLRRVTQSGFFSDQFRPQDHTEPNYRFIPVEGKPDHVDVEFVVQEGRVVDSNISGGVDSNNGVFGLISLTMRNFDARALPSSFFSVFSDVYEKRAFHGAGERLEFEISPGTELSRARLRYFYPDIFKTDLEPIGLDTTLSRRVRLFNGFDEDRFDLNVLFSKRYDTDLVISGGWRFGSVKVEDLSGLVPPALQAQNDGGRLDLSGPQFDIFKRELDDLRIPHDGYSVRWRNGLFGDRFGGDISMVTSDLSLDWYKPTFTTAEGIAHVFHAELDLGLSQPFGGTNAVPYTERRFAGGRDSLRGFDFRGVGPFDPVSGDPLGGETSITGSFEYYIPLSSVERPNGVGRMESMRASLFLDYGVLDPNALELDLDEVRASIGFGIGLVFPLPLQLNFAWPLIEKDGDQTQVLSFSFSVN